jgi:CrcB protein
MKIVLLMLGGALGTLARYAVAGATHRFYDGTFPLGTLMVNLAGSFVIGLLWGLWEEVPIPPNVRIFVFIGILGGFTTFSTYSLETLNLFRDGEVKIALINILASNVFGILLAVGGFFTARGLIQLFR